MRSSRNYARNSGSCECEREREIERKKEKDEGDKIFYSCEGTINLRVWLVFKCSSWSFHALRFDVFRITGSFWKGRKAKSDWKMRKKCS